MSDMSNEGDPSLRRVHIRPGQRLIVTYDSPSSARSEAERLRRVEALTAAGEYFRGNYDAIQALLGGDPTATDTLIGDTAPSLNALAGRIINARLSIGDIVGSVQQELLTRSGAESPRYHSAVARRYGGFLEETVNSLLEQRQQVAQKPQS